MGVRDALRKHEDQLLRLPNVTGVGIGERNGSEVIIVYVTRKVSTSELRPDDVVPKFLEGCAIVVEEIGSITPEAK